MNRCKKCKIAGEPNDLKKHEPDCIAIICKYCGGLGIEHSWGCIYPRRTDCRHCEGTGVQGGLAAVREAHEHARNTFSKG